MLVLRALGLFTALYNREPDHLIGSVVQKVLESIGCKTRQGAPSSHVCVSSSGGTWEPTPRRRICMGVLHKIASACGTKLAVHIDELSSIVGRVLQQLAPAERGVMTGKT